MERLYPFPAVCAAAFAVVASIGCGLSSVDAPQTSVDEQGAYFNSADIWQKDRLVICYLDAEGYRGMYPTEMQWIRDAVEVTWGTESGMTLVWSGVSCADAPSYDIYIELLPDSLRSNASIGALGDGRITLYLWTDSTRTDFRFDTISWAAVHEFGHALGLLHEQQRLDNDPAICTDPVGEGHNSGGGDTTIGPWDHYSVMNYCNPFVNSGAFAHLSSYDVQAANTDWVTIQTGRGPIHKNWTYGSAFPFSAITPFDGTMVLFWRDQADGLVHRRNYDGSWAAPTTIPGTAPTSGVSAVSTDLFRQDVFYRSASATLTQVSYTCSPSCSWGTPVDLGAPSGELVVGEPVAVKRDTDQISVIVRVYKPANGQIGVAVREWSTAGWGAWTDLPAVDVVDKPAVVAGQDHAVYVVVNSRDGFNGFDPLRGSLRSFRSATAGSWTGSWTQMETEATFVPYGAPAITTQLNSGNLNSVWVVARSSTRDVWVAGTALGSSTWGTWTNIGRPVISDWAGSPSVVSRQNNELDIFSNDTLGQTWFATVTNGTGSWNGSPLFGAAPGSPYAVAETGTGYMHVFNDNPKGGHPDGWDFVGFWQRFLGSVWSSVTPY